MQDEGCRYITEALIYQAKNISSSKSPTDSTRSFDFSDLTASLNSINNNRNRFSPTPKIDIDVKVIKPKKLEDDLNLSSNDNEKTNSNSLNNNNNSIHLMCDNEETLKNSQGAADNRIVEELTEGQDDKKAVDLENKAEQQKKDLLTVESPKPVSDVSSHTNPKVFARSISDLETNEESVKDVISSTKKYTTASLSPVISHDDNSTIHGIFADRSPERSFSSESLCSETSIESNDSKSSIKLIEQKFNKNGTLERQSAITSTAIESEKLPTGLQVLMFWNNNLTKKCADCFARLLSATEILQILNIGQNVLTDHYMTDIKSSIKQNKSVCSLGLQGTNLTCEGVKCLADIIQFGGNTVLQRIDLRNNEMSVPGLIALNEAMKSNKNIIQLDLDETPKNVS